jgi:hypothetical protein
MNNRMPSSDMDLEAALAFLLDDFSRDEDRSLQKRIDEFEAAEDDRLKSVERLIVDYLRSSTARPLCLVVFGTPGSGKSFGVKRIVKRIASNDEFKDDERAFPLTTLNLTQISGPAELAQALSRIAGEQTSKTVPFVFFDEFDTARDGAPLGWLSWFLAPMYDGQILHAGAVVRLERAVYIFAGGTASKFDEFSKRSAQPDFRAAKGPDFISRVHGYQDVIGPNDEPGSTLRRAQILKGALKEREKQGPFKRPDGVLRRLLQVGRFRHGSRSITTIVERSTIVNDTLKLPEPHFVRLHADRGPLDRDAIGGPIVVSGFAQDPGNSRDLVETLRLVAHGLWRAGATLAFGGRPKDHATDLMTNLRQVLQELPPPLDPSDDGYHRLIVFEEPGKETPWAVKSEAPPQPPNFSEAERASIGEKIEWVAGALGEFSKRLAMTEIAVARVAFGGAPSAIANGPDSEAASIAQRFPGIAEELMLSLALHQPVYIIGAFDGAARNMGTLLGLSRSRVGDARDCLGDLHSPAHFEKVRTLAHRFRPSPLNTLPITPEELMRFFRQHAIGSRRWPNNGLSIVENRQLFEERNAKEIVRLVAKGLLART